MKILYVGRLDHEKWINCIIDVIEQFIIPSHNTSHITISIYGKWSYSKIIQDIANRYPHIVYYYGRKDKKEIKKYWSDHDFFIMPSLFLETFGLTACESRILWVPVIGNKKWWLEAFIPDELNIQSYPWHSDSQKLIQCLSHASTLPPWKFDNFAHQIVQQYKPQQWQSAIYRLIDDKKDIIMISDFKSYQAWGVETHIHDACTLLKNHNQCSIYGHHLPQGRYSHFLKTLLTCWSIFNIYDWISILYKLQKREIWHIRWHGVSRTIGRLPIAMVGWSKKIKNNHIYITHHELWLFHPFPSQITQVNQIPQARSLLSFIRAGKTNNILKKIAIIGKYILISMIHYQLHQSNCIHIVPSEWMLPIIREWYPHATIKVIPHFVSI